MVDQSRSTHRGNVQETNPSSLNLLMIPRDGAAEAAGASGLVTVSDILGVGNELVGSHVQPRLLF